MILIVGGGITGLAAARTVAAAGAPFLILEREAEPGGWCRSFRSGRYLFDMGGHFLHFSDPGMREWVRGLGGVSWRTVSRDARVFLRGKLTPYPFQANLHGHSPGLVQECLSDFAAERIREAVNGPAEPANFEEWLLARFGKAMCREFFFPYNRKMWRTPLKEMGYGWTSWSVPVPAFQDLLAGARGETRTGMGYNPSFLYPRSGGIGSLVTALAAGVRERLRTGTKVVRFETRRRIAWSAEGEAFPYEAVVATGPLPEVALSCEGLPAGVRSAAGALRWVKVLSVNLGVPDPRTAPGHWVYVPERAYPFFRVGILSNVSPSSAPKGCACLFVEKSFPSRARIDVGAEVRAAIRGLVRMGVLRPGQTPEETAPFLLDPAYVVFDHAHGKASASVRGYLRGKGIFAAGRYGAWDYNGMEASMADGMRAAREALRRVGVPPR
ncbi:MAG TPA: FAD-dependent oxidoreductase [Candidatus Deferrimicrobiaceae bacterium]